MPAGYHGIAWISDDLIAVATPVDPAGDQLLFLDLRGQEVGKTPVLDRPECASQSILAVTRLPTGEAGFADVCERESGDPAQTSELLAYDVDTSRIRSLGRTGRRTTVMAWKPDMTSAIYTAEGSLCATLYEYDGGDEPFPLEVVAQGRRIPLGEDLDSASDRCTHSGNADYPAFARTGSDLAVLASSAGPLQGQDRIDSPWALLVASADGSVTRFSTEFAIPAGWLG